MHLPKADIAAHVSSTNGEEPSRLALSSPEAEYPSFAFITSRPHSAAMPTHHAHRQVIEMEALLLALIRRG